MKAIKTLLAISLLSAAATSNAAIIGYYSVTVSGTTSGAANGSLSGSGTAIFDDSGILTIDYTALNNQPAAGSSSPFTTTVKTIYTGTISGIYFTTTSGTTQITSCSIGSTPCPVGFVPNAPQNLTPTPISGDGGGLLEYAFDINGFYGTTNTSTTYSLNHQLRNSLSFQFACVQWEGCAPPTYQTPIPISAWLFGSGLAGLTGISRRRQNRRRACFL